MVIVCFWVTFRNELKIDVFSYVVAYSLPVRNQWFIPLFIDSVITHCRAQSDLWVVVDKTSQVWFTAVRKHPQVKDKGRIWVPGMRVLSVQRNWTGGNRGKITVLLEIRSRNLEKMWGDKTQGRSSVISLKVKNSNPCQKAASNHDHVKMNSKYNYSTILGQQTELWFYFPPVERLAAQSSWSRGSSAALLQWEHEEKAANI